MSVPAGVDSSRATASVEIGRALWRGRGEISGVAGSFKKKKITTEPLMVTDDDEQDLHVKNLSQEGGTDRGVVSVKFVGADGWTENVLDATSIELSSEGDA